MAYVVPTVEDFATRFPTLVADIDVADQEAAIQPHLDAASNEVDDSWIERDYAPAILLLAAHYYLSEKGQDASGQGNLVSEHIGPISVTLARAQAGDLSTSSYGSRFASMRRSNFPGVAVV